MDNSSKSKRDQGKTRIGVGRRFQVNLMPLDGENISPSLQSNIPENRLNLNENSIFKLAHDTPIDSSLNESWRNRLQFVPGMIESRRPYYPPPSEINKQIAARKQSKLKTEDSSKATNAPCIELMRITPNNIPIGVEVVDSKPSGYNYASTLGSVYRNVHNINYSEADYIKDRHHEKSLLRQERKLLLEETACKCKTCKNQDNGLKPRLESMGDGDIRKSPKKKYITTKVIIPTFGGDFVVKQIIVFGDSWKPPVHRRSQHRLTTARSDTSIVTIIDSKGKPKKRKKDQISLSGGSSLSFVKSFCNKIKLWIKSRCCHFKKKRTSVSLVVSYTKRSENEYNYDDHYTKRNLDINRYRSNSEIPVFDLLEAQNAPSTSYAFRTND